jgi:hypothetical protein
MARDEIGVQVGLDDVGDAHAQLVGGIRVDLHLALGVDDRAGATSPQQVGAVGDAADKELLQNHGVVLQWR